MFGMDTSPLVPLVPPQVLRSPKRPRLDAREPITNQFDVVSPTSYESFSISGPTAEGAKRSHKKQTLSCAECRRLKLKCSRSFPCQACQKRGCASICPLGALTSGKGSRFILANTEELHAKIAEMSDRIQQLEDALRKLPSSFSTEPHPLLHPDLLRIKSSAGLHTSHEAGPASASSPGADEIHENDLTKPLSQSSPLKEPIRDQPYDQSAPMHEGGFFEHDFHPGHLQLPAEIFSLSKSFPVPWKVDLAILGRIKDLLPPRLEAEHLCGSARMRILWQYNLDPSETFLPNLLHHIYSSSLEDLSSRRLALLLLVIAFGLQVDDNQLEDCSSRATVYYHLARAALCAMPIMECPDLDLMHALVYMMWYLLIFSGKDTAANTAWSIMGLTAKLAQSLGLHRDGAGWKVIPEEVERRRFLLWELLTLDARLALSLSRPPSFNMKHISCKRPNYDIDGLPYASKPLIYLQWKHDLFETCMGPVLETVVSAKPVEYAHILTLDIKLRDFYVPPELNMFSQEGLSDVRPMIVQQLYASTGREIVTLQLHRNYFIQALNSSEPFTLKYRYAPSVVAIYNSTCRMVTALEFAMKQCPQLCERIFGFWFNIFSAVIAMCFFVSRAPHSPISSLIVQDFQRMRRLFLQIAEYSPRAARSHALLEKMLEKATRIFTQFRESRNEPRDNTYSPTTRAQLAISDVRSSHFGTEPEVDPFEQAHSTLQETRKTLVECQDPLAFVPGTGIQLANEDIRNGLLTTPAPPIHISPEMVNQSINFDHGALTLGPDDQSLMTWF